MILNIAMKQSAVQLTSSSQNSYYDALDATSSLFVSSNFELPAESGTVTLESEGLISQEEVKKLKKKPSNISIRSPIARRTIIPRQPTDSSLSLINMLKSTMGQDLAQTSFPVNFNEPLSMLQRMTELFAYSSLLDSAANCQDEMKMMTYVAAFVVSGHAHSAGRVHKPFNPLLRETFECDRTDDLGWRLNAEQISHHPSVMAYFCESNSWKCWQEIAAKVEFRGNTLQMTPSGNAHLKLKRSRHHFMWHSVPSIVQNLLVGSPSIEYLGDLEIKNLATGDCCRLAFKGSSFFSSSPAHLVQGSIVNRCQQCIYRVKGIWNSHLDIIKESDAAETPNSERLWTMDPVPTNATTVYGFNKFSMTLNEVEPNVAPTDSRLRPDIRLLEQGKVTEASAEKKRLEEQQRERIKKDGEGSGVWFQFITDIDSNTRTVALAKNYWRHKKKQNWSMCPNIF